MKIINIIITTYIITLSLTLHAAFIPTGIHNDVNIDTVVNEWGWEITHRDSYASTISIEDLFSDFNASDFVMLASVASGSDTFDVLASALLTDVTSVTARHETHVSNGVSWYYNSLSLGFAGENDVIRQGAADFLGLDERDRLSWHTNSSLGRAGDITPESLIGGWRSGDNYSLNRSTEWERVVLRYSVPVQAEVNSTPVSAPSNLLILIVSLIVISCIGRQRLN